MFRSISRKFPNRTLVKKWGEEKVDMGKLTVAKVKAITKTGLHGDGDTLDKDVSL